MSGEGRRGDPGLLTEAVALFGDQSPESKARIARLIIAAAEAFNTHSAKLAGTPSIAAARRELIELAEDAARLAGKMRRLSPGAREAIGQARLFPSPATEEEFLEEDVMMRSDFPDGRWPGSRGNISDMLEAFGRLARRADRVLSYERPNAKARTITDWHMPNPKRALAVTCGDILLEGGIKVTGTRGSTVHILLCKIYEYATGERPDESGGLDEYAIHVGKHYAKIAKIREEIRVTIGDHAIGVFGPGSDLMAAEFHIRQELGFGLPIGEGLDCEPPVGDRELIDIELYAYSVETPPSS